jgi:hypothetical protein
MPVNENVVGVRTMIVVRGVAVRSGTDVVEAVQKMMSPVASPCGARVVTTVGEAREFETIWNDPPG